MSAPTAEGGRAAGGLDAGRLGLLWLAAVASRLLYLAAAVDHPALWSLRADGIVYHAWAARIAGGDLVGAGAWPAAPLFAYLLGGLYALAGVDATAGRIATALVGAAVAPLAAVVAARRAGAVAGVAAGLLAGLYAPLVASDAALQKEGLAAVLLLAGIAALDRPGRAAAAAAGAALGTATLVREFSLLALPVWALLDRRRAAALLLGAAVVLALPVARNLAITGAPTPTTGRLGPNLWIAYGPEAGVGFTPPAFWDGRATTLDEAFSREAGRRGVSSWTAAAAAEAARRPGRAAALVLARAWTFVRAFVREDFAGALAAPRLIPLRIVAPVGAGVLIPLGMVGLIAALGAGGRSGGTGRAEGSWIPPAAVLAAFFIQTALLFPLERYRIAAAPVWACLAGAALAGAWTRRRAVLLTAAAVLAWAPVGDLLEERVHEENVIDGLAEALRRNGLDDEAGRLRPPDAGLRHEEDRLPVR